MYVIKEPHKNVIKKKYDLLQILNKKESLNVTLKIIQWITLLCNETYQNS